MKNFEASMNLNEGHVLIYPEGLRGIGKGFENRYELQRVSSSIVRMALKYKTDIVHFASINAEYIHPFAFRSEWLNRIGKRLLGLPFLPLTILLPLILIQPWVFYMAFPANLTFVRKSRIRWQDLTDWMAVTLLGISKSLSSQRRGRDEAYRTFNICYTDKATVVISLLCPYSWMDSYPFLVETHAFYT